MHQILMNLYANAAVAMDVGVIRASTGTEKDASLQVVEVEETGSGIPEDQLEKIFDSGFKTKGTGHGFGLAVSRRIVENHQAEFEVKSSRKGHHFPARFPDLAQLPVCLD